MLAVNASCSAERLFSGCVASSAQLSRLRQGQWATYNAAQGHVTGVLPTVEAQVNGLPVAGAEYHTCDPLADGFLADGVTPACANVTAATCTMPGMSANEIGVRTEQSNMLCFCSEKNGGVDLHDTIGVRREHSHQGSK